MKNKVDAKVIRNNKRYEVRCGICGKLLLTYKFSVDNVDKAVDKSSQRVIIVTRCTRNDCKADNLLVLS